MQCSDDSTDAFFFSGGQKSHRDTTHRFFSTVADDCKC